MRRIQERSGEERLRGTRSAITRRLALPSGRFALAAFAALAAPLALAACGLIIGDDPTQILPVADASTNGEVDASAGHDASVASDAGEEGPDGASTDGRADTGTGATDAGADTGTGATDAGADTGTSATDATTPPACAPAAANATDLYVDTSFDGGTGTATCPYATITAALGAASTIASVTTVHVAPGKYGAGETFPLQVRGISLVGADPATTIVQGEGIYDHSTEGGQFPGQNLSLTFLLGSNTTLSSLSGITVKPATISTEVDENHLGILCDRGNITTPGWVTNVPAPNTFLDNMVLEVGYVYPLIVSTTSPAAPASLTYQSGCNAKVTGTTFKGGLGEGVWALGGGRNQTEGTEQYQVALTFGDDTKGANVVTGFSNPEIVGPTPNNGIGLLAWDDVASVIVANSRFEAGENGVAFTQHAAADSSAMFAYFEVRTSTFTNLTGQALYIDAAARLAKLTDNTFSGNTNATGTAFGAYISITLSTPSSLNAPAVLSARGNQFIGNDNGVVYANNQPSGEPEITLGGPDDWGTSSDPGGNVFRCNGALADAGAGFDFVIAPGATTQVTLAGNAWDHAPPTVIGSSAPTAVANGTDVTYDDEDTSPDVSGATLATVACPAGRTP